MKYLNYILILFLLQSCSNGLLFNPKKDTVYIYVSDTVKPKPKYSEAYPNFTETRHVTFDVMKSYEKKKYFVTFYLWIDGNIAYSDPNIGTYIEPSELEVYKSKIRKICNDKIPELIKVWN